MKFNLNTYILFLVASLSIIACKKEYATIEEEDDQSIQAYLTQNNLTGFTEDKGIHYKVIKEGTGEELDYTKRTPVIFTVRSLDGEFAAVDTFKAYNRFASYFGYVGLPAIPSASSQILREFIKQGVKKSGGEIRMIIPSRLAYGKGGYDYFEGYNRLSVKGNVSLDVTAKVIGADRLPIYEDAVIRNYLGTTVNEFLRTESGLYYKVIDEGFGAIIGSKDTVVANYTLKFLNGATLETGADYKSVLDDPQLRPGWTEGIQKVKRGGRVHLIMPSHLAYGLTGSTNMNTGIRDIPPFSQLSFEVSVTDVKPYSSE